MQKMRQRTIRIGLMLLNGFLGVTAVIGGLGLLLRVPFFSPSLDLLAGSPFGSYAIPGLALLILVGGGGLLAMLLLARRSRWGAPISGVVGTMIVIFEAVELAVIGFTVLLAFYIGLGVLILTFTAWLWLSDPSISPVRRREHQLA